MYIQKRETRQLNIKVMVKNGIIAKMSTVEGTLSERDKAMFRVTTYVCYFYAHLINGKVIRTKDMPRYLIGGNN